MITLHLLEIGSDTPIVLTEVPSYVQVTTRVGLHESDCILTNVARTTADIAD
jgi:hypothetical protein